MCKVYFSLSQIGIAAPPERGWSEEQTRLALCWVCVGFAPRFLLVPLQLHFHGTPGPSESAGAEPQPCPLPPELLPCSLDTHLRIRVGASHPFQRRRERLDLLFWLERATVCTRIPFFFFFFFSGSLLVLSCGEEEGGLQKAEAVPGVQEVFGVNRNVDRSDCVF